MRLPVAKRVGSAQVPAVDEGLEDVLLDGEVAVGDGGHSLPQVRQRVNGLGDAEVPGDVVRGRLGTEPKVVADVLLDGAVPVVAADDRIRPVPGRVLTEDPLLGPRTIKGSRVHDARGPTMHSADRPRHSADDRPIVAGVSRAFSVPFQLLFSTLSAERTHVTSLDHRPGPLTPRSRDGDVAADGVIDRLEGNRWRTRGRGAWHLGRQAEMPKDARITGASSMSAMRRRRLPHRGHASTPPPHRAQHARRGPQASRLGANGESRLHLESKVGIDPGVATAISPRRPDAGTRACHV